MIDEKCVVLERAKLSELFCAVRVRLNRFRQTKHAVRALRVKFGRISGNESIQATALAMVASCAETPIIRLKLSRRRQYPMKAGLELVPDAWPN